MSRLFGLIAVTSIAAAFLTGCSNGGGAEAACTNPIVAKLGAEVFTGVEISESLETPGGAIDIRGSFDGGTFACGLTAPSTLEQALVFMDDGSIITVQL